MNPDLSISNCFSILDSLLSNSLILIQLFVKRWPSIGSNENWESLLCVLLWKSVLVPIEFSGMLDPWRPGGCQQLIRGSLDCTELTGSGTNANAKSIIRNAKSKTNAGKTLVVKSKNIISNLATQLLAVTYTNMMLGEEFGPLDCIRLTDMESILMPFRIQSPMRNINTNVITNANMMPGAELGAHCSAPLVEEGPHHYWGLHSCVSTDPCMAHHFDAEFLPEIFLVTICDAHLHAHFGSKPFI